MQIPIPKFLILVLAFALSGCVSMNPPQKHVRPIPQNIVVKYGLNRNYNNLCLFEPKYTFPIREDIIHNPFENDSMVAFKIENTIANLSKKVSFLQKRYKFFEKEKVSLLSNLAKQAKQDQSESAFDLLDNKIDMGHHLEQLQKADNIVSDMPIFMPIKNAAISSKFGMRKLKKRKRRFHRGLDLASAKGAPIYAAANGTIIEVSCLKCFGKYIVIQHKNNIKTKYAHLSKLLVSKGQKVAQGQKIGIQGSTGRSTRDHLHFEVVYRRKHLNPYFFVGKETGCEKRKL